ncbi:MAG: tetratricopeptide repeat protein [Blastocatellia bacterium]|nr:tetratricopeptide repeat protein [Blastocatellia bacterium]
MTGNVEPDLKLEIAHILTIDVVAYSTLLMDEQSRLMKALNQTVRETACFRKAETERRLLRLPTGDGMVLVFQSDAEAPLECARQIATALQEHPEIQLRMGIHSGPINTIRDVNDRVNVAGAGVDTAQRVMDCGDAGHILVSKRVADDLAPLPRWNRYLHDLGECEVKHGRKIALVNFYDETFGNPELPQKLKCQSKLPPQSSQRKLLIAATAAVLLVAAAFTGWRIVRAPPPQRSIAVLPFVDVSPAKDQEYFSDGISEQIINSLAKVRGLFVVARTSSFALKNANQDVREVGQRLHVNHVLEGSVSHGAGKFRVDVRLVNVADGYQIWSETFDSSDKDVLSLQSDVAKKVAAALRIELGIGEIKQIAKQPTYDHEAYDLYLRGRYLLNKRTPQSVQSALTLFQQAISKDPRFASGHAGISDSYIQLGKIGVLPGVEAAAQAWPEVSATLALDDQLADGYVLRAILLTDFEWNWPAAEADFRKALELDPNSAAAHHWYARHLAELGRFDEALREITTAQKLDPLSPMIRVTKAKIYLAAGKPDQAIDPCRKALEMEPEFASAYQLLGRAHTQSGEYSKAIEAAKKYVELSIGTGWAKLELAYAYAVAGNKAEADRIVDEVTTRPGEFSPYDMAAICSASRDTSGAVAWLGRAIEQRSVDVIWARVDPRLDNVRSDPRFGALLARLVPHDLPH